MDEARKIAANLTGTYLAELRGINPIEHIIEYLSNIPDNVKVQISKINWESTDTGASVDLTLNFINEDEQTLNE